MDVEVDIDGKIALSEEGEANSVSSQEQLDDEEDSPDDEPDNADTRIKSGT
jgi:hypothetical protein